MSNINTFLIGNNIKCSQSKPRLRFIGHSVIPLLGKVVRKYCVLRSGWTPWKDPAPQTLPPPKGVIFKLNFYF